MKKKLPYLPKSREILYVPSDNKFMLAAKKFAEENSQDSQFKTGAVIVQNSKIIGRGANGSDFHKKLGCVRKFFRVKTGKKYWLCPGCSPKNHAEQSAIKDAKFRGISTKGADLYLWGHWWCCQSCWEKMIEAEIKNVYLEKK
jgi:deoxycytidylate deaminase